MKKIYFLLIGFCFFGSVHAQIVNIPDANFKAKLLEASTFNEIAKDLFGNYFKIDANNDGNIQVNEALQVSYLGVWGSYITNLTGIENFTALTTLNCSYNQLTSLNVSSNTALTILDCFGNKLTSLNVSSNTALTTLSCGNNLLTSLNVSSNTALILLSCGSNQLTSLNVSGATALILLSCGSNQLTSLNVSSNTALTILNCSSSVLESLNVSSNTALTELYCNNNQLTSLNVSSNTALSLLYCENNQLTSLLIKNGKNKWPLDFSNNPNLQYICADEAEITSIQNTINSFGLANACSVNSYCSFSPGGTYYTIQGANKFDNNTNGCDALDLSFPNFKLKFSNDTNVASIISNTTGSYYIPVSKGTYTLTQILEYPSYFSVAPASLNVTFPTQSSPFTQDFCITPNGVHPDLEVSFLPKDRARPGFDASYKIIYKNKGTITQSGSVKLTFDDTVLDVVSANPVFTSQSIDNLSWEYIDLKPFETRAIEVTLNVNSPMEIPAVNNGDRLSFTALINPVTGDELPVDNSFALRQLVVGSYDPNDKTCLEGSTIAPSAVGKYVHYLIRFENKGTAEAENVVVKDMIDTSKFDISSLVVTEGSHPFVTKISDTNKVEFIFEKINLPFDDATNDGYVAFKIKTKPSLVLGDSFSNTASIYFDYNFPIITNTATTSVLQSLGTQDFEFTNYFTIYPNPVTAVLNITAKETIEVKSISIYNTLGQLVIVIPNAEKASKIDVSQLLAGNYFIKVSSNKGSSSVKFIKN